MLTEEQLEKIWLLSDTVLYPEAVAFIRRLVNDEGYLPLPNSQVKGLESIAESYQYDEIDRYVKHQRDRNWPSSKQGIKALYTELEKIFTTLKNKRLRDEFHLVTEGRSSQETRLEVNALMVSLAREFIQHMVAENGILEVEENDRRAKERREQREQVNRR